MIIPSSDFDFAKYQAGDYGDHCIIHGDCRLVLPKIPDKAIDLVLTDPPYGMSYESNRRKEKHTPIWDDTNLDWLPNFMCESHRVMSVNSHFYCFCNDYAISAFRHQMCEAGIKPKRTLVWVKNNHTAGDLDGDYGCKTEFCVYGVKGVRTLNGKRNTNVLEFDKVSTDWHPTEKPVDMITFLIGKSSSGTNLILDPFLGSGTTLVAAKNLGRRAIGIEINYEYCKIAEQRMAQEVLSL